jgi:hypothetical protein
MRLTTCFILLLQTFFCLAQPPSEYSFQSIGLTQGASKTSTHTVNQDHFGYLCASDNPCNVIGLRTASLEVDKGNTWTVATVVNNSIVIPNKKSPGLINCISKPRWFLVGSKKKYCLPKIKTNF